jgi:hypothetical protein
MAQPANTFSSYDAVGNREDLADIIYDISPTETPFLSAIAKVNATATNHEWQTDSLAAAAENKRIQGDDATTTAAAPTARLGNYTQISDKVPRVTRTQQTVNSAGRGNDMDYQIMKMGKELKRDMEFVLLSNNAKVVGNDTTASELAGVPAWIATNTEKTDGADPTGDGTDARSDGTGRVFSEALLKSVLQQCWNEGGDPNMMMVGSNNKQKASTFGGNAERRIDANDKALVATVDIYVSDFGQLQIVANRFQRARDVLILQTDMWALAELDSFKEVPLAKTGDSDRVQLICEYTLESRNEKASGIVADCSI